MATTRYNIGTGPFARLIWPRPVNAGDRPDLAAVIGRIRERWRLRLLIDGLLWTIALATALILVSAWLLHAWHFAPPALWVLRLVNLLALLALVLHFCVRPLRRQVDDARVALYLEEHESGLNSVMLSAVDARAAPDRADPVHAENYAMEYGTVRCDAIRPVTDPVHIEHYSRG